MTPIPVPPPPKPDHLMTPDEFQAWLRAQPMNIGRRVDWLPLCALGLAGECGEVVELLKKYLRDDSEMDVPHLTNELGDALACLTCLADFFEIKLSTIMDAAATKIARRVANGTLRGKGEHR